MASARRLHGDPNAVGKKLRINGFSYSIIGIMPRPSYSRTVMRSLGCQFLRTRLMRKAGNTLVLCHWTPETTHDRGGSSGQPDNGSSATREGLSQPDADLAVAIQPLKEIRVGGVR